MTSVYETKVLGQKEKKLGEIKAIRGMDCVLENTVASQILYKNSAR